MSYCYKHKCNDCLHCTIENQTKEIIEAMERMNRKRPSIIRVFWSKAKAVIGRSNK